MKILGYSIIAGERRFVMKCDASLLNNRKPMFLPSWSEDVRAAECIVVRISRLGRCIQPRYADRYYDALANGIDFRAEDWLSRNYAQATAFESSLYVGEWIEMALSDSTKEAVAQAIAQASEIVTLRMGDLLYVDTTEAVPIHPDDVIEKEGLICKIK